MNEPVRRISATALVVIGSLGLVIASTGWWLERSLLDTGRFTGTANRILDQSDVQDELTRVLVRQLSREAGADLQIAEPFLASVVTQVVDSGAFRAVFNRAVSTAHEVLVDQSTGTIVLDLTGAYDQIKGPLQQVAPNLASELPSRNQLDVLLLHRSQLTTVWDVIDDVKRGVDVITIVAVVLLAAGIALASRRWQALARAAWVFVGGLAVLVLAVVIGRVVLQSQIGDAGVASAVGSAFRVITRSLLVQCAVIGAVGILIALAARFTDRHGRAAWAPTARGWWARLQGALPRVLDSADHDASAGALARLRLPAPRGDARAAHTLRAIALLALGLFAVFDPDGAATVLIVAAGIGVLYLAVTEAIAATASFTPTGNDQIHHNR